MHALRHLRIRNFTLISARNSLSTTIPTLATKCQEPHRPLCSSIHVYYTYLLVASISSFHTYQGGFLRNCRRGSMPPDPPGSGPSTSGAEEDEPEWSPKDDAGRSLLAALGMRDWAVRVTKDEIGREVVTAGGRVTAYVKPGPGRLKHRLVEPRLVDDFGVWDIEDLTEGQFADYFAAQAEG